MCQLRDSCELTQCECVLRVRCECEYAMRCGYGGVQAGPIIAIIYYSL